MYCIEVKKGKVEIVKKISQYFYQKIKFYLKNITFSLKNKIFKCFGVDYTLQKDFIYK